MDNNGMMKTEFDSTSEFHKEVKTNHDGSYDI